MVPAIRNNRTSLAPFGGLSTIFDRFFEDALAPLASPQTWGANFPLSVWQDDAAVHVEIDAPGVTEKEVELTVHDGNLIVRGERKTEENRNGYDTRTYGRFEQWVRLPAAVDAEKVEAKLANGVLSVTCPKTEATKARKIAIKSE